MTATRASFLFNLSSPMPVWNLRRSGGGLPTETRSLADWGLSSLRAEFASQDIDTLSFSAARDFDADDLFPYGCSVELLRSGAVVFLGRIVKAPRRASADSESIAYEAAGPWWWLDHLTFEQLWRFPTGRNPDGSLINDSKPLTRLLLGRSLDGDKVPAGDIISEVFSFIAAKFSAPISLGSLSTALSAQIPSEEVRDLTCAEVLRRVLRWFPGVQASWSLSAGHATLNLLDRASLRWSLDPASDPILSADLTPRPDLRPSCVLVRYFRYNTFDGSAMVVPEVVEDKFPPAADPYAPDALRLVIQLDGASQSTLSQPVSSSPIHLSSPDWWRSKVPKLAHPGVADLVVVAGSTSLLADSDAAQGNTPFANELLDGAVPYWTGCRECPAVASATVSYTVTLSDASTAPRTEILKLRLRTTDALSQTYRTVSDYRPPEPIPSGLAQRYFSALDWLQYDGSVVLAHDDWDGLSRVGYALDLAGFPRRPEWATIGASVVRHSVDLDTGRSTLVVGPARHLAPDDWISLSRPARGQVFASRSSSDLRSSGSAASSATPSIVASALPRQSVSTLDLTPRAASGGSEAAALSVACSRLPSENYTISMRPSTLSITAGNSGAEALWSPTKTIPGEVVEPVALPPVTLPLSQSLSVWAVREYPGATPVQVFVTPDAEVDPQSPWVVNMKKLVNEAATMPVAPSGVRGSNSPTGGTGTTTQSAPGWAENGGPSESQAPYSHTISTSGGMTGATGRSQVLISTAGRATYQYTIAQFLNAGKYSYRLSSLVITNGPKTYIFALTKQDGSTGARGRTDNKMDPTTQITNGAGETTYSSTTNGWGALDGGGASTVVSNGTFTGKRARVTDSIFDVTTVLLSYKPPEPRPTTNNINWAGPTANGYYYQTKSSNAYLPHRLDTVIELAGGTSGQAGTVNIPQAGKSLFKPTSGAVFDNDPAMAAGSSVDTGGKGAPTAPKDNIVSSTESGNPAPPGGAAQDAVDAALASGGSDISSTVGSRAGNFVWRIASVSADGEVTQHLTGPLRLDAAPQPFWA